MAGRLCFNYAAMREGRSPMGAPRQSQARAPSRSGRETGSALARSACHLSVTKDRGVQADLLNTTGYLASTVSVLLLGGVAWASSDGDDWLRMLVVLGILSSMAGMFMRWLSY
jgi:hypothetical protein